MSRPKIIATIGPATQSAEMLEALVRAGANTIRLNFSHGSHEQHAASIQLIHQVRDRLQVPLAILADLQGPKHRTGPLAEPFTLYENQAVTLLASDGPSLPPSTIATPNRDIIEALMPGNTVLINDGRLRLQVTARVGPDALQCQVQIGGLLEGKKGINVPETHLNSPALTDKDKADLLFCLQHGVEYLALSFVRKAEDIRELKDAIVQSGYLSPWIIAKIEKPEALDDLDNILAEVDGLMVARGDLGVELSLEQVPLAQKRVVAAANNAGKLVIIATQMLESMTTAAQPTRAEVSDVANAVLDGADVLMLSQETAMGRYPAETVAMMRTIIEAAESTTQRGYTAELPEGACVYRAIAQSACFASQVPMVQALVVISTSGSMALRVSKLKPKKDIIALTPDPVVYQRLSLLWGVTPFLMPFGEDTDRTLMEAERDLVRRGVLHVGDRVVLCAGNTPFLGATNMMKIQEIVN
jgi:pyruvate kinase